MSVRRSLRARGRSSLRGRSTAIGARFTLEVAPESGNSILRYPVFVVTGPVVGEDRELLSRHDVGVWLRLDLAPNVADFPLQHCTDVRGNLAIVVFFRYLKGLSHGEWSANHVAVTAQRTCQDRIVQECEERSDGSN